MKIKDIPRQCWKWLKVFLDWNERFTDEYSDTFALVMITVGGLLASVAIGELPKGGTTGGYSFVYLKYPLLLKVGLASVVVGFITQLSDNLSRVHKLTGKRVFWLLAVTFVSLVVLALAS